MDFKKILISLYVYNKRTINVNRKLFFFVSNFCPKNSVLHFKYIDVIYIIMQNLQLILFFIYLFIERFKKVFIHCFTICFIIIDCTTISFNIFDKIGYIMELWIV